jgi:hypothetical protein
MALVAGCFPADADDRANDPIDSPAAYDAALEPLKERSDVLEDRFAAVQGEGYRGPRQVRRVLSEIIPEYAALLDETRAIEVEGVDLEKAHDLLLASLMQQQDGLQLALRGLEQGDTVLVAEGGQTLKQAQALVRKHRRVLARARD